MLVTFWFGVMSFSEDGLSAIATKIDTPLMLESYTPDMFMQSWGRSSYARAMIELRADVELKDTIMMAMPKLVGKGSIVSDVVKNLSNPRQATRGVPLVQSGKRKQAEVARQEVSYSNPFDALNSIENDDELGEWGGDSSSNGKGVTSSSISSTPIAERIDKFKRKLIEGNFFLGMMMGSHYQSTIGLKRGSDSGYSTNSLWEQCNDDDYDPYDDDLYDSHDMYDNLQAICDDLDIACRGKNVTHLGFLERRWKELEKEALVKKFSFESDYLQWSRKGKSEGGDAFL
ncbi:hypothetical protein Tco_0885075 [Tanacetum coccineum]